MFLSVERGVPAASRLPAFRALKRAEARAPLQILVTDEPDVLPRDEFLHARADERVELVLPAMDGVVTLLQSVAEMETRDAIERAASQGAALLIVLLSMSLLIVEPVVRLVRRQHLAATQRATEFEYLSMAAQRTNNSVGSMP